MLMCLSLESLLMIGVQATTSPGQGKPRAGQTQGKPLPPTAQRIQEQCGPDLGDVQSPDVQTPLPRALPLEPENLKSSSVYLSVLVLTLTVSADAVWI